MITNKAKFLVVSILTSALLLTSIPMNLLNRAGAAQFVVVVPAGPHAGKVVAIISLSSAAAQAVSKHSGALQAQPVLSVSPLSVTLDTVQGVNQSDPAVTISNTGPAGSILNWSAVASAPWIGLSQASGTVAAGFSNDVVVGANVTGLAVGTYPGTITISDPLASNSPQTVAVTLNIAAKPITVTADAKSKVFGDADPALTYVSSDPSASFTGALSRAAGEEVGTYAPSCRTTYLPVATTPLRMSVPI